MDSRSEDSQQSYRIAVRGQLDESWSDWLGGMTVAVERLENGIVTTVITGLVPDQPALRGILNRLWDLNLTLISVSPISNDRSREEANR